MERIARDDEQALAELVAALAPSLVRFAGRALGASRQEAEDVVQELFIRVWKARHRWRPESAVKTYVFTIASRICLNRARGRSRAPRVQPLEWTGDALGPEAPDGAPDPERMALSEQLRSAMESEIAALPSSQRAALLLRHAEDLSYEEIAAALDTSPSAVESLLCRARARLRSRLAAWRTEGKVPRRG